ncbi:hypothetical protein ANCDUO_12380 [Ancylostoma duodenale]|uniref:Uncharacterized protein n=1 Tax=Ancylostoma duodenale TaxID=51022 RepID=A0A0C2CLK3_9BILA|nr:hypothetical protein ANCDUO_12380 [Ancylostoma duodenale]
MGLPMILMIVFLVWCPLLAFSLLNRIGAISIPDKVRLTVQLEGYPPIYEIESQGSELRAMYPDELKYLTDTMSKRYFPFPNGTDSMKRSRDCVSFIKEYSTNDVLVVNFRPESEVPWGISEESMSALIDQLNGNSSINFIVTAEISRPYDPNKKAAAKHSAHWSQEIAPNTTLRTQWINMLQNPGGGQTVSMEGAFPSYLLVPSEGAVVVPSPIADAIQLNQDNYQRPFNASDRDWFDTLKFSLANSTIGNVWVVQAQHPSQFTSVYFNASKITYGLHRDRTYVQTIVFVDRAFPSFFAKYLQGGIEGGDICEIHPKDACECDRHAECVPKPTIKRTQICGSLSDTSRRLTEVRKGLNMTDLLLVQSEGDIQRMESAALTDWQQRSVLAKLINALGSFVAANTDIICYFLAVLAHASGAGIITLPLPLMVFFWGTLSNPRPSKFFWVAMIAYTEFVIVTKFICQFTIFDFNSVSTQSKQAADPLTPEKVLGVQRQSNFAVYDVTLLFALFFHRYMLRKLGLWKDANLTVTFQNDHSVSETEEEVDLEDSPHRGKANGKHAKSPNEQATTSGDEHIDDEKRNEAGKDPVSSVKPGSSVTVQEGGAANPDSGGNPIARFIRQLFKPKFRYIRDFYPIMFGLDVVAFLIIAFGYSAFGEGGSGNVIGDIQSNRIPLTFVVMLFVMTLMIVIDRGLYLRKWIPGKLTYQLLIIVFLHIWIFFVLPSLTRRPAVENTVAKAFYVVKCLYLLVSAWQIRNGYPQLCIGNLLTHAYGLANMVCFKIVFARSNSWPVAAYIN